MSLYSENQTHFANILHFLADVFAQEPRKGGKIAAEALRSADLAEFREMKSAADPSAVLREASALKASLPIVEEVMVCQKQLQWACWEGEGLETGVSRRLFTTELIGPDGHLPSGKVRVGLLAAEKWTDYPLSSHSGEVTYYILAGVAEWVLRNGDYQKKFPGDFVHHPAWALHGRRTTDQPFLGAWRWSGDLDLSSFSVA